VKNRNGAAAVSVEGASMPLRLVLRRRCKPMMRESEDLLKMHKTNKAHGPWAIFSKVLWSGRSFHRYAASFCYLRPQ